MAMPVVFVGAGVPLTAAAAVYNPPTRQRGSAVLNVRNYGAFGDGSHDDTAAIQKAINSLPSTGGTVFIPAGTYLINAVTSIKLRSLMHLKLDPGAKLAAKATSSGQYNVVLADVVHDVEISGGQIVGERDKHLGTEGEGGHGIRIRGSQRVTIRDIRISKGWGDGITVGPKPNYKARFTYSKDVVVANVVCTQNRRNGLSIGNVIGMKVYDSEFSYTNGTAPQCGIDVEPDRDIDESGYNDQVWIENCVMRGNNKFGMNVWRRARNLTVTKCQIIENTTLGVMTTGLTGGTFTGNYFGSNMSVGLAIKTGSTNVKVNGNTFFNNYKRQGYIDRADFTQTGVNSKVQKDLQVGDGTSNITIGSNTYK
ncbi:MAG TPA: right-handed parallel beta-helix repeat-containing protein [Lysobacter sp.]|nr:right-handed parallel beta-helix repeat-containing protein [Lysobacter sp.]